MRVRLFGESVRTFNREGAFRPPAQLPVDRAVAKWNRKDLSSILPVGCESTLETKR
jgi:hypothetical protein